MRPVAILLVAAIASACPSRAARADERPGAPAVESGGASRMPGYLILTLSLVSAAGTGLLGAAIAEQVKLLREDLDDHTMEWSRYLDLQERRATLTVAGITTFGVTVALATAGLYLLLRKAPKRTTLKLSLLPMGDGRGLGAMATGAF